MPDNERRELEASEVFQFVLSTQATTRARFTVILQTMARILASLEEQEEQAILEELLQQFEEERTTESEALKDYLKRSKSEA